MNKERYLEFGFENELFDDEDLPQMQELSICERQIEAIDRLFLSNERGFRRDFGLTIFPFFAFFDSPLEILELDLRSLLNRPTGLPFLRLPSHKWTKVEQLLTEWQAHITQAMEVAEREGAERFIGRFMELERHLLGIGGRAARVRRNFQREIEQAVKPFFVVNPNYAWEEQALRDFGHVLGDIARTHIPILEVFTGELSQATRRNFMMKFVEIAERERSRFHSDFTDELTVIYQDVCVKMEHIWHHYRAKFYECL